VGAALLLIHGCAPEPAVRPDRIAVAPDTAARTLHAAGDFTGAAAEYERIAAADAANAPRYRLHAALAWLKAGNVDQAAAIAATTPSDASRPDSIAAAQLLTAALSLSRAEFEPGRVAWTAIDPARLPRDFEADYHDVGARALESSGRAFEAAEQRMALDPLLGNGPERDSNRKALWRALTQAPPVALAASEETTARAGWIALARIARTELYDPARFTEALAAWRARFPGHPADPQISAELLDIATTLGRPATHVALLLPLSGPYGAAGAAVRDGALAAWYSDGSSLARPRISIYDTEAKTVSARYDEALAAGADVVIGPLDKPALERLLARSALPVLTLALNQVDSATIPPDLAPRLYQFGLSPEGEARQVAERAWSDGHSRALTMAPEGEWGHRVAEAFARRWSELGGQLLETERYSTNYSRTTRSLLNIDDSIARAHAVERVLGRNVVSVTRRRRDAHFLFLAAFSEQARQIRPQLDYFFATDLPVYSTSHVYVGAVNTERDRDLDGISFGDTPWLISPATRDAQLYDTLRGAWPASAGSSGRLYALGIDAYRLLANLGRLRGQPGAEMAGQTGAVSVDSTGRVWRRLAWARFVGGRPVPARAGAAQ
jgi:hypothetical protein